MNTQFVKTAVLAAALLLGTASISAYAAGITTGGTSGTTSVSGGTGGNNALVTIGPGNGPLATLDSNGDPTNGGSQTNGDVNFGSLLDGIDLSGLDGVGGDNGANGNNGNNGNNGASGGGFQMIAASLSSVDRQKIKLRCGDVLAIPENFDGDVVKFCRVIAKM